jgi:hypothetical protein
MPLSPFLISTSEYVMTTTISIYCPKGGTGRTTLAVHLAHYLSTRGARVMLRDDDTQASAIGWAILAERVRSEDHTGPLPFWVGRGAPDGWDIIITDHGPGESAEAPRADVIVAPVSLDGVAQAVGLRTLARLRVDGHSPVVVASKYRPDRAEHRAALASEALSGAIIVRDRAALAGWYATGRTIYDPAHGRAQGVALARQDIDAVGLAVMNRLAAAEPSTAWLRDYFNAQQEG